MKAQLCCVYEDRLKIDRLEDHTSLCLVKNENFLYHINVFGTAHQPTVQGSYDYNQMTSFDYLKIRSTDLFVIRDKILLITMQFFEIARYLYFFFLSSLHIDILTYYCSIG